MKQRVISAFVALIVLAVCLCFFETPVIYFIVGAISALAVFELLYSTGYIKNKVVLSLFLTYTFAFPFLHVETVKPYMLLIGVLYITFIGLIFLIMHDKIPFTNMCTAFILSLIVPASLSVLIVIRGRFAPDGIFCCLLVLGGGWLSDVGAYFGGTFFGKHKLAPKISPKKTVEGALFGILTTVLGFLLMGFIYTQVRLLIFNDVIYVSYTVLACSAVICSVIGMVGDLFASAIKRQTGIKDYGNIMPGHGGVMDRFDSVLFVAPVLYFIMSVFLIVQR